MGILGMDFEMILGVPFFIVILTLSLCALAIYLEYFDAIWFISINTNQQNTLEETFT